MDLPPNARTYAVHVNGADLAILDYAPSMGDVDGADVVHLVHGYTGSKEDFSLIGPLLAAAGFRVIAHDHRGNNQSAHTPGHYDLEQLADDVVGIQEALGINRTHLLGHSFGGVVAQAAAIRHPQKVRSLTLFCSGPGAPMSADGWLMVMRDFLIPRTMREAWQFMIDNPDHGINYGPDPDISSMRTQRWINSDAEAIVAAANILRNANDVSAELAGHKVHVVYGEFDDAWAIDEQIRLGTTVGGVVTVIPDAGHCPNEERPEAAAAALIEYWKSIG